ncbi:MAG: sulfatase family protein [Planctomycetota bacterium]|jgi:arylsulfatase A-like enzyme
MATLATALLATLLAPGPSQAPAAGSEPAERPNVLVVVIDDAAWEDFAEAPTDDIAALSAFGRTYTRFHTSPSCSPSRYQLMFGRYQHEHFIGTALPLGGNWGAPTSEQSIAAHMSTEGYATGMFGKWHINGKNQPMHLPEAARIHGFDTWRAGSVGNVTAGNSHYSWERIDDGVVSTETRYTTLAITDALIEWWNETEGPRFAVCSYLAPHEPFNSPPPELVPESGGGVYFPREAFLLALMGVDNAVGDIAASIDLSNTWVFLMPDNGTPANAPPDNPKSKGYKLTPYAGGTNVPLIVWGPGLVPGVDDTLVQISDIPATILEASGSHAMPGNDQSLSFARTFFGGPGPRQVLMSHRFKPNGGVASQLQIDDWAIQNADGYKLVKTFLGKQLYDVINDPWETFPVVAPQVQAALEEARKEILGPDWPYPY